MPIMFMQKFAAKAWKLCHAFRQQPTSKKAAFATTIARPPQKIQHGRISTDDVSFAAWIALKKTSRLDVCVCV